MNNNDNSPPVHAARPPVAFLEGAKGVPRKGV